MSPGRFTIILLLVKALGLEDGHVPTFWPLYHLRIRLFYVVFGAPKVLRAWGPAHSPFGPGLHQDYFGSLQGPSGLLFKGDIDDIDVDRYIYIEIDTDVEVDVDIDVDRHFGCLNGGFKVCSGTVSWYRSSSGTYFVNTEIAGPV